MEQVIIRDSIFNGNSRIFSFDENGIGKCLNLKTNGVESISIVYIPNFKEIIEKLNIEKLSNNRILGDKIELYEVGT